MPDERWPTSITFVDRTKVLVRGYPIDELMGRITFGDAVYLLATGELPSPAISKIVAALLVGHIDYGAAAPATAEARRAARSGASLNAAIATGLLAFDHPGALHIRGCYQLLERTVDVAGGSLLFNASATEMVETLVQEDRVPPPGFVAAAGVDPRVTRLLQLGHELGIDSVFMQALRALEMALGRHPALADEPLAISVDGAIAAVAGDVGLDAAAAEGLALISRTSGLLAHVLEERIRGSLSGTPEYDGVSERRVKPVFG